MGTRRWLCLNALRVPAGCKTASRHLGSWRPAPGTVCVPVTAPARQGEMPLRRHVIVGFFGENHPQGRTRSPKLGDQRSFAELPGHLQAVGGLHHPADRGCRDPATPGEQVRLSVLRRLRPRFAPEHGLRHITGCTLRPSRRRVLLAAMSVSSAAFAPMACPLVRATRHSPVPFRRVVPARPGEAEHRP